MIAVAIADDDTAVRAGFEFIVGSQPDMTVAGTAGDGDALIRLIRRVRPDVALVDVRMPHRDGLDALRVLADEGLLGADATRAIVLTTFDLDEYVDTALRLGASGFLLKTSRYEQVLDAIRVVHGGQALLAPSVTRRLVDHYRRAAAATPLAAGRSAPASLTAREHGVWRLVARGLSNAEIAAELIISEHTVKSHISNLLAKTGSRDRIHLVVLARDHGI